MEATFCTLSVTTVKTCVRGYYLHCTYKVKKMEATFWPLGVTTEADLYQWLLLTLHILGPTNGSHFVATRCYYSNRLVSVVTTYTAHIRSRKWKPLCVH